MAALARSNPPPGTLTESAPKSRRGRALWAVAPAPARCIAIVPQGTAHCDPPEDGVFAPDLPWVGRMVDLGSDAVSRQAARARSRRTAPTAIMANGEPYPGDLLADILEYRVLRARSLGKGLNPKWRQRCGALEARLRAVSEPDASGTRYARAYHRFECRFAARLRLEEDNGSRVVDVAVDNLSAGGVKLALPERRPEGERVWLILERDQGKKVVLPARVAWVHTGSLGLMFAGAPAWQQ